MNFPVTLLIVIKLSTFLDVRGAPPDLLWSFLGAHRSQPFFFSLLGGGTFLDEGSSTCRDHLRYHLPPRGSDLHSCIVSSSPLLFLFFHSDLPRFRFSKSHVLPCRRPFFETPVLPPEAVVFTIFFFFPFFYSSPNVDNVPTSATGDFLGPGGPTHLAP